MPVPLGFTEARALSILNAWVTPSEAIVAVDTEGRTREGAKKSISKLIAVPHLNAAIGFRGQSAFLSSLARCCVGHACEEFDQLLEKLPAMLQWIDATLPAAALRVPGFDDTEMIAVGWSYERKRMLGRVFAKRGDAVEFSAHDSEGCIAPCTEAMTGIPKTSAAVRLIAQAQVRWMQAEHGIGGGKLIVCRVTREAIKMHHEMRFEGERAAA